MKSKQINYFTGYLWDQLNFQLFYQVRLKLEGQMEDCLKPHLWYQLRDHLWDQLGKER